MLFQHLQGVAGKMTEDEQYVIKMDALKEIADSGIDYCSCPSACPHHGKCWECVLIHRGHRDHLPYCFWDMVNEKIHEDISMMGDASACPLSANEKFAHTQRLTEGSFEKYDPKDSPDMNFDFSNIESSGK